MQRMFLTTSLFLIGLGGCHPDDSSKRTATQERGYFLNGVHGQLIDDQLDPQLAFLVLPQIALSNRLIVDIFKEAATDNDGWVFLYSPMLPVEGEFRVLTATPILQQQDHEQFQLQLPGSGMVILKADTMQTVGAWYVGPLAKELELSLASKTLSRSEKIDFIRTYRTVNAEFNNHYQVLHQELAELNIGPRPVSTELNRAVPLGHHPRLDAIAYVLEQFPDHECAPYFWNEKKWHEAQNWAVLKRAALDGRGRRVLGQFVYLEPQNPHWPEALALLESLPDL